MDHWLLGDGSKTQVVVVDDHDRPGPHSISDPNCSAGCGKKCQQRGNRPPRWRHFCFGNEEELGGDVSDTVMACRPVSEGEHYEWMIVRVSGLNPTAASAFAGMTASKGQVFSDRASEKLYSERY